ncbi:MAG: chain-length determining protein [Proteobacteria bacterium]|nr:MAG: chain-length determining protein [Pseudomonadota bacterium]
MDEYEEQSLEVGDIINILKRRKWHLIIPTILVILISVPVALLLPATFRSSATILIEDQDIPADFVMTTVTGYAEQRIQSTKQRIMSTGKLMEIIQQFNLYAKYKDRWTQEQMVDKMRKDIRLNLISADTIDRRTGREMTATIAFTLSYQGPQADTVQKVTDTLVTLFLSENLQVRQRQTTETSEFLEEETRRVRGQLDKLEAEITAFKAQHINVLPEMLQINMQSLNSMESSLQRLDDQIRMLREREGYLETQLASIPEIQDPMKARLKSLQVELVNLKSNFTDNHPDVKKLNIEIAELKKCMADKKAEPGNHTEQPDNSAYITLAAQLASTRAEIESLKQQRLETRDKVEMYRQRIETTPTIEHAYNALLIDQNNTRGKYEDLMRKVMEASVALGLEKKQKGERFTLIDPAQFPEKPFKPNRLAICLIGIVLGLAAGAGVTVLAEMTDQSIHTAKDLERCADFPLLVAIPSIVTPYDRRKQRRKRLIWLAVCLLCVGGGVWVFHTMVMDLNIFWAKVMRRMPSM